MDKQRNDSIIRIPLHFNFKGKNYIGEIIGKVAPFNRYFTCRIPGENMIILEAKQGINPGKFNWVSCSGNDFNHLVPYIGKEIEKFFC